MVASPDKLRPTELAKAEVTTLPLVLINRLCSGELPDGNTAFPLPETIRSIEVAPELGAAAAGRLDVARIAQVAIMQAAAHRRRMRWVRAGWLTGLAAAAALVLLLFRGQGTRQPAGAVAGWR